jgi:hypothetical protein
MHRTFTMPLNVFARGASTYRVVSSQPRDESLREEFMNS